jgi:hypothetical protein
VDEKPFYATFKGIKSHPIAILWRLRRFWVKRNAWDNFSYRMEIDDFVQDNNFESTYGNLIVLMREILQTSFLLPDKLLEPKLPKKATI